MFGLKKNEKYTRQDVWNLVTGGKTSITRNFQQSGYERINEDLFAFINIGYKGHAGQIFPNKYDRESEILKWYGKKETHSKQPLMKSIIDGFTTVFCFARWDANPEFTFLGVGKVVSYRDNFTEVFDKDGTRTFCLEFELDCKDGSINPAFIGNFDDAFEEGVPEMPEGREKWVRHKTRERNPEVVKRKKREFQKKHGRLFCEVCDFDFYAVYGTRGKDFIECHHNVPLHEEEGERITKSEDLTLLCSNCHRMIHRKKRWLSIEELRLSFGADNGKR